jgi:hypothetical protein
VNFEFSQSWLHWSPFSFLEYQHKAFVYACMLGCSVSVSLQRCEKKKKKKQPQQNASMLRWLAIVAPIA